MAKASVGPWSVIVPEEHGLVTVLLPREKRTAAARRANAVGVRLRLNPPKALLREDDHLFDLRAYDDIARVVLRKLAGAHWTDTTIGLGRVTFGFGVARAAQVRALETRLAALRLGPWKTEGVLVDRANTARLDRLHGDLALETEDDDRPLARRGVTKLRAALAKRASPGSFRRESGLDARVPGVKRVQQGLRWLSAQLEAVEPVVVAALGAPAGTQLGAYVNCHPRMRAFAFEFRDKHGASLDSPCLGRAHIALLAAHLDAPLAEARRVPGILWDAEVYRVRGAPRVVIDASS